ncbi:hypothetical protein FB451DRAFT_1283294 [Mycena latifolia]|nr:hypothetical protein FB451DRAFT_1283294 [Mycena latifolia]
MPPLKSDVEQGVSNAFRMAAIDDELQSLYARIASLKAERNSIIPISRIPNELLCHIFTIYAEDSISMTGVHWVQKLLLVCRGWYELALASQTLWSNVYFLLAPSLKCFRTQIDRSGAAHLKIRIGSLDSDAYSPTILTNAERLESLDLGGHPQYLLDLLHMMCRHQFPVLQRLSLGLSEDAVIVDDSTRPSLPPELLDGRMPRLRQIYCLTSTAPWESLSSLRYLCLTSSPDSAFATQISLPTLLAVLASSPGLHTLKLHMMVLPSLPEQQCLPVALPQLEVLLLRDFLYCCEELLTNLIFPATTCVKLYPGGITSGAEVRDILVGLRRHLRAPGAPIPTLLKLRAPPGDDETHFQMAISTTRSFPAQEADVVFSLNTHPASAPALRQIMTKVLKTLPVHGITHLDASSASLTVATWKTAFKSLPTLEAVSMHVDDAGIRFCQALLQARPAVALTSISVFAIILGSGEEPVHPFFDTFLLFLRACHDRGEPLAYLYVRDYLQGLNLSEAKWAELRSLVGDLVMN